MELEVNRMEYNTKRPADEIDVHRQYNVHFLCTYKGMDDDDDREMLYQLQLLDAFNIVDGKYDGVKINKMIAALYSAYSGNADVKEILVVLTKEVPWVAMMGDDLGFTILFAYDTFDVFHAMLVELITTNACKAETKKAVIDAITHMNPDPKNIADSMPSGSAL